MDIYKLERKEFKDYSKKFRNTFIGGRLYLIFDCMTALFFFSLFFGASEIFEFVNVDFSTDLVISTFLCLTLISYYVYFKYLKEYIEKQLNEYKNK